MLKKVALALRLSEQASQRLKPEINRHVKTARSDLIRVGVPEKVAKGNDPLIENAIITYCLAKMGAEDKQEAYMESYTYQADALRRHFGWKGAENAGKE